MVEKALLLAVCGVMLLLVSFSAGTRLDLHSRTQERQFALGPISVGYVVAPIPTPPTEEFVTVGDLTVLLPVGTDSCWDAYPLCVGHRPMSVRARGSSIQDGFTQ